MNHVSSIGRAEFIPFFIFVMLIGNFEFCVPGFEYAQRLDCHKAIVNLPIRVKRNSERFYVNLLSPLGAQNEDLRRRLASLTIDLKTINRNRRNFILTILEFLFLPKIDILVILKCSKLSYSYML